MSIIYTAVAEYDMPNGIKKGDTVSERYRIAFNSLTVIRNAPKGSPYTSKEKTAKGESITPELVDSSVSYKIVWGKLVEQKSKLEKQLNIIDKKIIPDDDYSKVIKEYLSMKM